MTTTFTLLDNQNVLATVSFADSAGNPVSLPAGTVPVWTVDNSAICTVSSGSDLTGLTALITAVGPDGLANVTVTTTIGSNAPIVASAAMTVSSTGEAPLSASISFGAPATNA